MGGFFFRNTYLYSLFQGQRHDMLMMMTRSDSHWYWALKSKYDDIVMAF